MTPSRKRKPETDVTAVPAPPKKPPRPLDPLKVILARFRTSARRFAAKRAAAQVHDFRVASRRMLAALDLVEPACDLPEHRQVRELLLWWLEDTSELSDAQVAQKLARERMATYPVMAELRRQAAADESRCAARAPSAERVAADAARIADAIDIAIKALTPKDKRDEPWRNLRMAQELTQLLTMRHRRLVRRCKAMDTSDIKSVHDVRIALRQLRYPLLLATPFFGAAAQDAMKAARQMQDLTGGLHDLDLLRARLDRCRDETPSRDEEFDALSRAMDEEQQKLLDVLIAEERRFLARLDVCGESGPSRSGLGGANRFRLLLLRHAAAAERADCDGADDLLRPLTKTGLRQIAAQARWLKRRNLTPDQVVSSPAVRALHTSAGLLEAMEYPAEVVIDRAFAPDAPPEAAAAAVRQRAAAGTLLVVVGHEPGLSACAALLLGGQPGNLNVWLRKGGLLALSTSADDPTGDYRIEVLLPPELTRRAR